MADNTLSTLNEIRIKIRRLTNNPSAAQITDASIDDYINTFILYDMPAYFKLPSLSETLTFFTSPHVGTYENNTLDATNPLYNFKNKYTNVGAPVYIGGQKASYHQSLEEFYNIYPKVNYKKLIGTGNGVTVDFTDTLDAFPVMTNQVTVSSINTAGNPLLAQDDGDGGFVGDVNPLSAFNYLTGQYYVSFTSAPANLESIWLSYVPYTAGQPTSVLFNQDKFIVRPIPDSGYRVEVQANRRPTELVAVGGMPELSEWWQYIALGSAIKVYQDRLNTEGVNTLMPEFKNQEILIGRRKINQNSQKRVSTIYANEGNADPFVI